MGNTGPTSFRMDSSSVWCYRYYFFFICFFVFFLFFDTGAGTGMSVSLIPLIIFQHELDVEPVKLPTHIAFYLYFFNLLIFLLL